MQCWTLGLWVLCLSLGFSRAIDVIPGKYLTVFNIPMNGRSLEPLYIQHCYIDFPGSCSYNLASHCGDSYQEFSVHIHRSLVNDHPFIDKITFTIKDVTVQMKSNLLELNGDMQRHYKSLPCLKAPSHIATLQRYRQQSGSLQRRCLVAGELSHRQLSSDQRSRGPR
ncbi:unnamed protein product [Ranitomeya imitator]|uniref:VWFD domain-containing protein n=1 Tax=Ranitomeya imitator TaxID=111125 RepID=A0ABN9L7V8_9NEOB|nr:unnamed protein product [Ranitomeya imitator]